MLTNSQHVTPAGPATQEGAAKSEEADITSCAFKLLFELVGDGSNIANENRARLLAHCALLGHMER